jgi:hypothetical protein
MIELTFKCIDVLIRRQGVWDNNEQEISVTPDNAIEELNYRFRENDIGYQFTGGEIIRVDSQFAHAEITKPAIALLSEPIFKKANENFLEAHRHYRDRNFKDAVVAANRAFESALKAICTDKKWEFANGARASDLIKIVRSKGLFPDYIDKGLDTFIAVMKAGLPEVRNNAGGHGEAPAADSVPEYISAYALHLAATNLLLVASAYKHLGKSRGRPRS